MPSDSEQRSFRFSLAPAGVLVMCAVLWPAVVTFDIGDWPSPNQYPHNSPPANACGIVGAWCSYQLHHYLGDGAYPLLLFATLAAAVRLARGQIGHVWERVLGVVLLVAGTSASAHLISTPQPWTLPVGHGGIIGYSLGELLRLNLDRLGTLIVLVSSMFIGLLFATEGWVLKLPMVLRRIREPACRAAMPAQGAGLAQVSPPMHTAAGVTPQERAVLLKEGKPGPKINTNRSRHARKADDTAQPSLFDERHVAIVDESPARPQHEKVGPASLAGDKAFAGVQGGEKAATRGATEVVKPAGPSADVPGRLPSTDRTATEPRPRQAQRWRLPPLALLHQVESGFTAQQEQFVRKQAQVLERTLEEFRLDARVVEIDTGPVITMFELKLGAGIKVSQIATLSNDIARALKAHAIRVVAPISGKNTVGIEVPNTEKEAVRLRDLILLSGKRASSMGLPLFLGKDAAGAPLVADLTRMPHLLIAGTTGSGKSVCLNAVILSLLMTKGPDQVKMILVDPKMVEMSLFKDLPHLMCPIVTDMIRAEKILAWAVTRMDERYELFAETRVKDIAGYNALGADEVYARLKPENEQEKARIYTQLPYIVIVIDELADLMMTAAKEVEHHLSRLAQKSRAVGVHIIVATQRPEARVVTGLIKSNLPSRICFRVASRMDSRIVLDQNGGEVLLGQGDMLFLPPGSHKLVRAQGTFLEESEVRAVLDDLASHAKPEFHPQLVQSRAIASGAAAALRDPLFAEAVQVVLESRRGSVSLLQRRLTIGYSRASRLIEEMAEAGIVGMYKGSQAREVLITADQWEAIRERIAEDGEASHGPDRSGEPSSTLWDDRVADPAEDRRVRSP